MPRVTQDEAELDFAARYAPIIMADEREPFAPVAVGYTIFRQPCASPSFAREVDWSSTGYPATAAVEYALWWDYDSGHVYELEHAWTFVSGDGQVVAVEASWHGMFGQIELEGKPIVEGTHPVLLAQPGKHAMAGSIEPFEEIREWAEREVGPEAGKDGVLETKLFQGRIAKSPENDLKVTAYLKKLAFTPAWRFNKRFEITRAMLIPWPAMEAWIPARVEWLIEQIGE